MVLAGSILILEVIFNCGKCYSAVKGGFFCCCLVLFVFFFWLLGPMLNHLVICLVSVTIKIS